ncbi:MAG: OadG-related small transporter subunit [Candidatus Cloacimonadaceae bacterium]|jgi:threonine/homoserine/homoserine lactone efflux protein|nr:hypothetical protein [Candidatus Cloacimonadota bacterium]MDX9950031.1 OadG-related small transporter subunit [Candidatus Syntrophosphaera sp.]NLN84551.1 hypothetical protein [Candidatus Cloacimonadota bacterium]
MTQILLASVAQNFKQSLLIMAVGMAGIFIFMGLIFLLILALEKLLPSKEGK